MAEKKPRKRRATGAPRRRRKPSGVSTGLAASELENGSLPPEVIDLQDRIANDAGKVLAAYREPFADFGNFGGAADRQGRADSYHATFQRVIYAGWKP